MEEVNRSDKERKEFNKSGFPKIRIANSSFYIKAFSYVQEREFLLNDVERVLLTTVSQKSWYQLLTALSWKAKQFRQLEPHKLIVKMKNGGDWDYEVKTINDPELREFVRLINNLLKSAR